MLDRADLKIDDIDLFEVNEAFAAQALAVIRELGLPPERTNPNGSGVSLGHPIGATGAILTVKALYELRRTGGATRWSPCASAAARASPPSSSASSTFGSARFGKQVWRRAAGRPTGNTR